MAPPIVVARAAHTRSLPNNVMSPPRSFILRNCVNIIRNIFNFQMIIKSSLHACCRRRPPHSTGHARAYRSKRFIVSEHTFWVHTSSQQAVHWLIIIWAESDFAHGIAGNRNNRGLILIFSLFFISCVGRLKIIASSSGSYVCMEKILKSLQR